MRITGLALAVAVVGFLGAPAYSHHGKDCRPYTIDNVCGEKGRPCHLHMVYARGHSPAATVPDGYWYSARPLKQARKYRRPAASAHDKRRASVYATCRSFTCWYRHDPEHRY